MKRPVGRVDYGPYGRLHGPKIRVVHRTAGMSESAACSARPDSRSPGPKPHARWHDAHLNISCSGRVGTTHHCRASACSAAGALILVNPVGVPLIQLYISLVKNQQP
ncbi:hypothetical protein J5N97_002143 [Dioscorea zingiberensis]|uniref:Uncharacterized protein n=1 Tax=Dioscorea zingiberensis TaxID=325984 RepID=A0A9D5D3U7_9LILI|nr:hypothetical protein J5N97_002143 [Dioscorea zingiberensis]